MTRSTNYNFSPNRYIADGEKCPFLKLTKNASNCRRSMRQWWVLSKLAKLHIIGKPYGTYLHIFKMIYIQNFVDENGLLQVSHNQSSQILVLNERYHKTPGYFFYRNLLLIFTVSSFTMYFSFTMN